MRCQFSLVFVFVALSFLANPVEGHRWGVIKKFFQKITKNKEYVKEDNIKEFSLEPFGAFEAKTGTGCVLKNLQYLGDMLIKTSNHLVSTVEDLPKFDEITNADLCSLLNEIKSEAANSTRKVRPGVFKSDESAKPLKGLPWKAIWENVSFTPGKDSATAWAEKIKKGECNLVDTSDYFTSIDVYTFVKNVLKKLFPEIEKKEHWQDDPFVKEFGKYKNRLFFLGYQNSQRMRVSKSQKLAKEIKTLLDKIRDHKSPDKKDSERRQGSSGEDPSDMDSVFERLQQKVTLNQREWASFYTESVFDSIELQNRILGLFREIFEPLDTLKSSHGTRIWMTKYKWLRELQVEIETSGLHELQRFELNFNDPEKCLMAVNEESYCIKPTRWDYWLDFVIALRDALLNLQFDDKNPCKFNVDVDGHPMLLPILHQMTDVCLRSYLQQCMDDKVRSAKTNECEEQSDEGVNSMLKLFEKDKLISKEGIEAMIKSKPKKISSHAQYESRHRRFRANKGAQRRLLSGLDGSQTQYDRIVLRHFVDEGINAAKIGDDGLLVYSEIAHSNDCDSSVPSTFDSLWNVKKKFWSTFSILCLPFPSNSKGGFMYTTICNIYYWMEMHISPSNRD